MTGSFCIQVAGTARNGTLGGGADAWATFGGASATPDADRLRGSFNISGIVRNGNGNYTVSFANDMPNTNYCVVATTASHSEMVTTASKQVGSFGIISLDSNGSAIDAGNVDIAVFATDGNAGGFWVRTGDGANEVLKPLNDDATIEAAALTDGITTKTMTEVLAGGGGGGDGDTIINYNGAAAWGDVANNGTINGGMNISRVSQTIQPDGTVVAKADGIYYVTFANPLPDSKYSVTISPGGHGTCIFSTNQRTPLGFQYRVINSQTNTPIDFPCNFAVHALNALPPQGGTGTDAWASVAADGTTEASFNLTSTRTAVGTYTLSFVNPMPSTDYAITLGVQSNARVISYGGKTVNGFNVFVTQKNTQDLNDTSFSVTVNATNAQLPDTVTQEQLDAILSGFTGVAAWAVADVETAGTAAGTNYPVLGGSNIASIVKGSSAGTYNITFDNALPNANYAVVGNCSLLKGLVRIDQTQQTATGFVLRTSQGDNNALVNTRDLSFAVYALNALPPKGGTGTDAFGTVAANGQLAGGSFNIASVTTSANQGVNNNYTVTFVNPMPDTNYSVQVTCEQDDTSKVATLYSTVAANAALRKTRNGFSYYTSEGSNANNVVCATSFTVNATNAVLPQTITEDQIAALIQNPTLSAWARVNVNGISNNTNGTLEGSFNIEECKRTSAGEYTFKFINPVPAGYSVIAICDANTTLQLMVTPVLTPLLSGLGMLLVI